MALDGAMAFTIPGTHGTDVDFTILSSAIPGAPVSILSTHFAPGAGDVPLDLVMVFTEVARSLSTIIMVKVMAVSTMVLAALVVA
jgi:hypothetical protein